MIYSIVTIISLLIGYLLGRSNRPVEELQQTISKAIKTVEKKITPQVPTGIIKPKTAAETIVRRDIKRYEGLKAMKESLDANPELKELNDKVKAYKKAGLLK